MAVQWADLVFLLQVDAWVVLVFLRRVAVWVVLVFLLQADVLACFPLQAAAQ